MKEKYYKLGFIGAIIFGLMGLSVAFGSYLSQAAEKKIEVVTKTVDTAGNIVSENTTQTIDEKNEVSLAADLPTIDLPEEAMTKIEEMLVNSTVPINGYNFAQKNKSNLLKKDKKYFSIVSLFGLFQYQPGRPNSLNLDINGDGLIDIYTAYYPNAGDIILNNGDRLNFSYNINYLLLNNGDNTFRTDYYCFRFKGGGMTDSNNTLFRINETYIGDCADTSSN